MRRKNEFDMLDRRRGFDFKKLMQIIGMVILIVLVLASFFYLIRDIRQLNEKVTKLEKEKASTYTASGQEGSNSESFTIYLPEKLYAVSGTTLELYDNQVTSLGTNIEDYNVLWVCDIGKNMERKFSITAKDEWVGEYPLELKVMDNNGNCLASASTTLCLIPNALGAQFSLLTIGDSLSADPATYTHLSELSQNNIIFMGTMASGGSLNEARLGFSANDYLNETAYQYVEGQPVHPFYNKETSRFDWNYYKQTTGFNPDVVEIALGTNGSDVDPTSNGNNIIQIIDYIRQDDPSIPIYVVNSIYPADQNGIGTWQNNEGYPLLPGRYKVEEDKKMYNLMVYLADKLKDYDNLYLVPEALTHDSANNFKNTLQAVNPYSSITESVPTDGFHPGSEGYYQMADTLYSTILGTMSEWKK